MSEISERNGEELLDLLRMKARTQRRLERELEQCNQRQYDLQREHDQASAELREVLRQLGEQAANE